MKVSVITALDIGSSFVRALIGQYNTDGKMEIKGIGEVVSDGMDKGLVKDIQAVSLCVKKALEMAEGIAELKAENVFINITGEHIRCVSVIGRISVSGHLSNEPAEITPEHINQVINDAKNSIKTQKGFERLQILHGLPQYYDIDDQNEIYNPINMTGYHLTAHVLLILADITSIRNLLRCVEVAGYSVEPGHIVLSHIAAGLSTLSEDERKLGAVVIDVGGGCCDIAFYNKGNLIQTYVVPMAGNNITRDLAIGLRTTIGNAENVKVEHGNALSEGLDPNQEINVDGISGRSSLTYKIAHVSLIIQSRLNEFMETCYQHIKSAYPPELITAGIILSGGSAKLNGIDSFVSNLFNMPVKTAVPDISRLCGPISRFHDSSFCTVIGLLYYGMDFYRESLYSAPAGKTKSRKADKGLLTRLGQYVKEFFS